MNGDRNQKIATLEYQRSPDAFRMMNESMIVRDAETDTGGRVGS